MPPLSGLTNYLRLHPLVYGYSWTIQTFVFRDAGDFRGVFTLSALR